MRIGRKLYGAAATAALVLTAAVACDAREEGPMAADVESLDIHGSHLKGGNHAEVLRWLAGLQRATAKFHDIDAAGRAGWDTQITECMELPGTGGMGFHYGNPDLIDGTPQQFKPELLVYEPQKNGRLRLVAVEYIVPFDAWTSAEPPSLHGISFHRNEDFGLWVLHAWIWKYNPDGIFADWNPRASCRYAQAPQSGS